MEKSWSAFFISYLAGYRAGRICANASKKKMLAKYKNDARAWLEGFDDGYGASKGKPNHPRVKRDV